MFIKSLAIALLCTLPSILSGGLSASVRAADRLVVTQGSLSRGISVVAIKRYVETGEATENLAYYVDPLSAEEAEALRQGFQASISLHFLPFSRFLNSSLGEGILEQMALAIQPGIDPQPEAGVKALRGALIGAAEDGRFNLLELLERYPHQDLVLDQDDFDPAFQELGGGFQDLLASVGLRIDFVGEELRLSDYQEIMRTLFDPSRLYLERVERLAQDYGLDPEALNSTTAPPGEITLPRAELYQLYQDLQQIRSQTLQKQGIQIEYLDPADQ